jgi:hypothetical protein
VIYDTHTKLLQSKWSFIFFSVHETPKSYQKFEYMVKNNEPQRRSLLIKKKNNPRFFFFHFVSPRDGTKTGGKKE